MTTLYITHPACLNHLTPIGHPERPDRLRAIEAALSDEKFQFLSRVEAPMAPDCHHPMVPCRRRTAELHPSAIGQRCGEQRVLAVDALVAHSRDLLS